MPRPRRSEKSKQDLLTLGAAALAEHGFHGTGLKQLLDQAGVPKGSFYNYFDSKEHYAAEMIDFYNQALLDLLLRRASEPTLSPLAAVTTAYRDLIALTESFDCKRNCLLGSMAAEISADSPVIRHAVNDAYGLWHDRMTELLTYAQQAGELRTDMAASDMADLFWNAWQGAGMRMLVNQNAAPLRQVLDLMLGSLFRPQPATPPTN